MDEVGEDLRAGCGYHSRILTTEVFVTRAKAPCDAGRASPSCCSRRWSGRPLRRAAERFQCSTTTAKLWV